MNSICTSCIFSQNMDLEIENNFLNEMVNSRAQHNYIDNAHENIPQIQIQNKLYLDDNGDNAFTNTNINYFQSKKKLDEQFDAPNIIHGERYRESCSKYGDTFQTERLLGKPKHEKPTADNQQYQHGRLQNERQINSVPYEKPGLGFQDERVGNKNQQHERPNSGIKTERSSYNQPYEKAIHSQEQETVKCLQHYKEVPLDSLNGQPPFDSNSKNADKATYHERVAKIGHKRFTSENISKHVGN